MTFSHCIELAGMTVSHEEEEHMFDTKYLHLWRVPKGERERLVEEGGVPPVKTCSCGLIKWNSTLKFDYIWENDSSFPESETAAEDSVDGIDDPTDWKSLVVDLKSVSINAMKTAVLTACTVLQIRQYIENVN